MSEFKPGRLLRTYWYIVLLVVVVLGATGYVVYHSGMDHTQLLSEYGYLVILAWTFLEGETIVILAGAFAGQVGLEPLLIAVSAFCGSFLSDQLMFSLGKHKGEQALRYFPRIARNVDRGAKLLKKYDTILILGFRFIYGVRNVTPIMLGISGVSHKKFFFLNWIGASVWAASFTYGGLYLGKAFKKIAEAVGHGILYFLLIVAVVSGILWLFRARHSVKQARTVSRGGKSDKDNAA